VEIHTRDEAGFWQISETRGLEADCGLERCLPGWLPTLDTFRTFAGQLAM